MRRVCICDGPVSLAPAGRRHVATGETAKLYSAQPWNPWRGLRVVFSPGGAQEIDCDHAWNDALFVMPISCAPPGLEEKSDTSHGFHGCAVSPVATDLRPVGTEDVKSASCSRSGIYFLIDIRR